MGRKLSLDVSQRFEAVMALMRREEPTAKIARRYGVSEVKCYRLRERFSEDSKTGQFVSNRQAYRVMKDRGVLRKRTVQLRAAQFRRVLTEPIPTAPPIWPMRSWSPARFASVRP